MNLQISQKQQFAGKEDCWQEYQLSWEKTAYKERTIATKLEKHSSDFSAAVKLWWDLFLFNTNLFCLLLFHLWPNTGIKTGSLPPSKLQWTPFASQVLGVWAGVPRVLPMIPEAPLRGEPARELICWVMFSLVTLLPHWRLQLGVDNWHGAEPRLSPALRSC